MRTSSDIEVEKIFKCRLPSNLYLFSTQCFWWHIHILRLEYIRIAKLGLKLYYSRKVRQRRIIKCDRFRDHKLRQSWIANCDRVWIKKCDKNFRKWITKRDDKVIQHSNKSFPERLKLHVIHIFFLSVYLQSMFYGYSRFFLSGL